MRSKTKPEPCLCIKHGCYRAWKGAGHLMLRQQQERQWWLLMEKKLLPVWTPMGPVQLLAEPSSIPVGAAPLADCEHCAKRLLPEEQIAFLPRQLRAQLRLSRILAG